MPRTGIERGSGKNASEYRELFTRSPQADRGAESICVRSDFDLNSENTKYPLSEIAAR